MKALLASLALATVGFGADASEATQFDDAPGTFSRAEVKAATGSSLLVRQIGDATVFTDPVSNTLTRAEVRAQAAAGMARSGPGISYGEATQFAVM